MTKDEKYMSWALEEAEKALESEDAPIGAVIVKGDNIIGSGYNQVEKNGDPSAHAEMIAIKEAVQNNGYKRLLDCDIYVTVEPCAMCAGAIVLARLRRIVFGAYDPKAGACGSLYNIPSDERLNHKCEIVPGVLQEECSQILKDFFKKIRNAK